jgi:hypothetical protein
MTKSPCSIVTLESKADDLRRIARDFGVAFTEQAVPDEPGAIRFFFELTDDEQFGFLNAIPRDVFARQAYVLGPIS